MHECEDARDADRLRKRSAATAKGRALTKSLMKNITSGDDEDDNVEIPSSTTKASMREIQVQQSKFLLQAAGWLHPLSGSVEDELQKKGPTLSTPSDCEPHLPSEINMGLLKEWRKDIQLQEKSVSQSRRNALDPM
jgi:hypothetical protein